MNTQVNRDQFLAGRKKGIGGSDVAAILGFSPYKSPYQLWLDKTGRSERKESQNESAHFGNLLEDVVAKEFSFGGEPHMLNLAESVAYAVCSYYTMVGCICHSFLLLS